MRLAEYQTASVFGGLPLYVDGLGRMAVAAIIGVVAVVTVGRVALRAALWSQGVPTRILLAAAVAPPLGLLLLGVVFNNTPIELRYLSFGLPFIALAGGVRPAPRRLVALILAIQFVAIAGLLFSPRSHAAGPSRRGRSRRHRGGWGRAAAAGQ